jgi:Fe-S cluster assembly protein SufD
VSAVGTAYAQAFAALPPAQREQRHTAWQRFQAVGFPTTREEDWRYTDLASLNDANFSDAVAQAKAKPTLAGWQGLHFINGRRLHGAAAAPQAEVVDNGVCALNAALVSDGLDLSFARNTRSDPMHVVIQTTGACMSHLRHRVRLEAGAEATLLIESASDGAAALSTGVFEIELQANSRLTLLRLQDLGSAATELFRTEVRVDRDAQFDYVGVDLGGALVRHDLNVFLNGAGAGTRLDGVFAPGERGHCDTHTRIHHVSPHTTSRETYRGLVRDKAHAVFNGKIVVEKGAQKTDSEQSVASLLLSPGAQINAKPELEIYADDVRCAHGATCGQLDDTAIYYLRSRGLDRQAARNLLLYTFVHPIFAAVSDTAARAHLQKSLLARLDGGEGLRELVA